MHPLHRGHVPLQVAALGFQVAAPLYTRSAAWVWQSVHTALCALYKACRGAWFVLRKC
jgi:hypothetical protein